MKTLIYTAVGIAGITTLASCSSSSSTNKKSPKEKASGEKKSLSGKNIIIIGAGISGLACAKKLMLQGANVKVLESTKRVGGRIKTTVFDDYVFEEGAAWIHGNKLNPIVELAEEAKIETHVTDFDSIAAFDSKSNRYSDKQISDLYKQYYALLDEMKENGKENVGVGQYLQEEYPQRLSDPLWLYVLSSEMEFDNGGDIKDIATSYFDEDEIFEGDDLLLLNGYEKIPNNLARDLDVIFDQRVHEIGYTDDTISVNTKDNKYECDYCVVSVPLGVLKSNKIIFKPELPADKSGAIERLKMGTVNKLFVIFDEAFWPKDTEFFVATNEIKGKYNLFVNMYLTHKIPVLTTFTFGEYSLSSEGLHDSEIEKDISHQIDVMFKDIRKPIKKIIRTKWNDDENTFGCYSFATNGAFASDNSTLASNVDNKIFFAGEHTSTKYPGTVHGAYLSGLKAADEILD